MTRKTRQPLNLRLLLFVGVAIASVGVLAWRLIDLQLVQGAYFLDLADANRLYTESVPAERGVFLDRYGQPLTVNIPAYYKMNNTESLHSSRLPLTTDEALIEMASDSSSVSYTLNREYLYPVSTAHVLGYVGAVTKEELEADSKLSITDKTGKLGLEKTFDAWLRGVDGERLYEVNALGERQHLVAETPSRPGINIKTTIDPYLSEVAHKALGDQRGAVLILDANTGEILTLVSAPSFNASLLGKTAIDPQEEQSRRAQVSEMFNHPQKLFFNRAISGMYPPGSVFKIVTALAALESDAVDINTIVTDDGVLEVGDFSYANWYYTQYGRVEGDISLERAIARSNDIYFYRAAEWTGPDTLAELARVFGFGHVSGIEIGSEATGLVPDPAWKEHVLGERWFLGNTYHFGIGQGNLLTTPLQVAQLTQAMGNRGTACQPTLVQDPTAKALLNGKPLTTDDAKTSENCSELGIQEAHLNVVLHGMLDACSAGGTAYPFFEHNAQYRDDSLSPDQEITRGAIACKTGTAEFGGTDEDGYKKTHGWFAAIVGLSHDQILGAASGSAQIAEGDVESSASADMTLVDRTKWRNQIEKNGFPSKLAMVALVESDEAKKYKEGSSDAAPVIKTILDWVSGR